MSRRGIIVVLLALAILPGSTHAVGSQSLAISPAYQQAEVNGDTPVRHLAVQISNFTASDETFKLSTTDFTAQGENGAIAFLGQNAANLNNRFGLAAWMSLDQDSVSVPAGGSVQVGVTITNQAGMAPGGHYGAVLAAAQDTPASDGTVPQVGVKQVLSSLVLVTKDGGGQPNLKLVSQTANGGGFSLPLGFDQRFQNAGNVHVTPRGVTVVTDPLGRAVTVIWSLATTSTAYSV